MTTNKDLEQIAKQVSLLNRLIELLTMQETKPIQKFGWIPWVYTSGENRGCRFYRHETTNEREYFSTVGGS